MRRILLVVVGGALIAAILAINGAPAGAVVDKAENHPSPVAQFFAQNEAIQRGTVGEAAKAGGAEDTGALISTVATSDDPFLRDELDDYFAGDGSVPASQ